MIGNTITIDELKEEYDYVFLATGAATVILAMEAGKKAAHKIIENTK